MSLSQHRLGHYELQQRLRSDPLSEMWKAFDDQQHRYVVITILRVNPQVAADLIPRFQCETQGLTSLHHPNIARVLDVQTSYLPGIADGNAYLVMEYIEGRSLDDYLQTTSHKERFPTSVELARLLAPIGAAIDYAHQCGIVHGKIKPSNVLLDKCCAPDSLSGEPRLIGFGMRSIQAFHLFPLEDAYYTAPELAQGNMENSRSDIYSLGVILYELCTGTLPFRGDLAMDVIMQHIHTPAPSPALIKPGIQPALTAVIMRCLAKDPVARFPTASIMVGALASALSVSVPEHLRQADSTVGNKMPSLVQPGQDTMNSPTHKSLLSLGLPEEGIPFVPTAGTGLSSPMFPVAQQKPPSPVMPAGGGLTGRPAQTPSEALEKFVRATSTGQQSVAQTPILPVFTSPSSLPVQQPAPKTGPSRRWSYTALCVVLVAVVLGSLLSIWLRPPPPPTQPQSVGHAFFISSGLVSQNSNQGIADGLQIALQGLTPPHAGKAYYAWLLGDNNTNMTVPPVLLGSLPDSQAEINLSYQGDALHSNLLARYSRLLITEEDAGLAPPNPSVDSSTWRYFARFSTTKPSNGPYALLDHLRHLLAQDPKLKAAGLIGGLDIWLFRNTLKILEWTGSARDAYKGYDSSLIQRQVIRVLDYLDGEQYVGTENLPVGMPELLVDPTIARVALLEINPTQQPPGYLKHIGNHLLDIIQVPGVTAEQRALAIEINQAINNVQSWLNAVHKDAEQLINLTPAQLQQPSTQALLDHMFMQAAAAFVGQTDPNTGLEKTGVAQIHYDIQRLATFNVIACPVDNTANVCT